MLPARSIPGCIPRTLAPPSLSADRGLKISASAGYCAVLRQLGSGGSVPPSGLEYRTAIALLPTQHGLAMCGALVRHLRPC